MSIGTHNSFLEFIDVANTGANCCLSDPKTIGRPRKGKMCHAAGRSDSLDLVDYRASPARSPKVWKVSPNRSSTACHARVVCFG
jgi:hypothetical protein